jgi:hypothetical protein
MQPSADAPHITQLNPTVGHGFMPPPPPSVPGSGLRGLQSVTNKATELQSTATRLQQSQPSIGMHPTFRSDFNVSLRYFSVCFYDFIISFKFLLILLIFLYFYDFLSSQSIKVFIVD